jgi:MFS superfamily sulfate permease-like transporter
LAKNIFSTFKSDLPASIVVFFVALPLCLGIASASGAPLFSGLISGIVGGIVVGGLSGSKIGVSGPAAGLIAIVLTAISNLGSYENFLLAVVLGGVIQLILGVLRAGIIGYYFPSSVIKGMLTGIGIIIIIKQIPHFFGYDASPEGDFSFFQINGDNTFSEIFKPFNFIQLGPTSIGFLSLGILLLWDKILSKKNKIFLIIQGPLVAVASGILFYIITMSSKTFSIAENHMVSVPIPKDITSFIGQFSFPNFSVITNPDVWIVAFTIALVASIETLLCVEATDKLDPDKNITPTNRELLAQGIGNIFSGLIGGIPITQVIVRSSANIQSGGKSKMSAIIHGLLLLISVVLIPTVLNKIPLSVLAAILLLVGYKLASPRLFKHMFDLGWKQFTPYTVTVLGIVFIDLLYGIGLGLLVGIVIILIKSFQNSHLLHINGQSNGRHKIKMTLAEEVNFFHKVPILKELNSLPINTNLELDIRKTNYLDYDIIELLEEFGLKANEKNIDIKIISENGIEENVTSFIEFFKQKI